MEQLEFYDREHEKFYIEHTRDKKLDRYNKCLLYLLGLTKETRENLDVLYNETSRKIEIDGTSKGWQTGTSLAVTKLAFNLFNGYCGLEDQKAKQYTVENIFAYKEYAQYFYEAIKIRFNIK